MKELFVYTTIFLSGTIIGFILQTFILRDRINSTDYEINKPKMKNSEGGTQQFKIEEKDKKQKGIFRKIFKSKQNE